MADIMAILNLLYFIEEYQCKWNPTVSAKPVKVCKITEKYQKSRAILRHAARQTYLRDGKINMQSPRSRSASLMLLAAVEFGDRANFADGESQLRLQ